MIEILHETTWRKCRDEIENAFKAVIDAKWLQ
jgi:hypothetical protein